MESENTVGDVDIPCNQPVELPVPDVELPEEALEENEGECIYYVYTHCDPRTFEIRYVGMGQGQRAWMMRPSKDSVRYGHRKEEHYLWFKGLESEGYTLSDIVSIINHGHYKKEALLIERKLINSVGYDNLFNTDCKAKNYAKNKDKILLAKKLRNQGLYYSQICKEMGEKSHMTVWRYVNEY